MKKAKELLKTYLEQAKEAGIEDYIKNSFKVTRQILKDVDAFVVVLDTKYLLSAPELVLLQNLTEEDSKRKIFVVMNRSESLLERKISELKCSLNDKLKEERILNANIYAISAENPTILDFRKFN